MGKTIVSESVSTLADVDDLINAGKLQAAESMLRNMQDQAEFKRNPDFWFKILLVGSLLNQPLKDIEDTHKIVQTYKGWDDLIEMDYQRDITLRQIRSLGIIFLSPAKVAFIKSRIESSLRNAYGDPNREAATTAVLARLLIAQGKFQEAAANCEHADRQWAAIKEGANQQWRRNNTFHWFIATRLQLSNKQLLWSSVTTEGYNSTMANKVEYLLSQVIDDPQERNKSRKAMALLIFYTGRLGYLIYRLIAKYHR